MSQNAIAVIKFLQSNKGLDFTVHDVAAALGLSYQTVGGVFTGLVKKGLGVRVEATVAEGEKPVKYLALTNDGLALDLNTVEVK